MRIDFHTHILPAMDDGAKTIENSVEMLKAEKNNGVDVAVLTPHFYKEYDLVETFLKRRKKSYETLLDYINKTGEILPKVLLGAEIHFSPSLINDDLSQLCISNTDYILLELPFQYFSAALLNQIRSFVYSCPQKIILAHLDRYFPIADISEISEIISLGTLVQINCDSILKLASRRNVISLLKNGQAQIIGTDCHNMDARKPNYADAMKKLSKKTDSILLKKIEQAGVMVLNNRPINDVLEIFY